MKSADMDVKYYVYTLSDPRDGNVFYVGKGQKDRAYMHLRPSTRNKGNRNKCAIVNEIYAANLTPIVSFVKYFSDEGEAYDFEFKMIFELGRRSTGGILVNMGSSRQPSGMLGKKHSDATKAMWSAKRKGRKHRPETRQLMSEQRSGEGNALYGKKGEDHPLFGFKHSTEECQRRIERISKWYILTDPDGESFEVKNLTKWCRDHDIPYSRISKQKMGWSVVKKDI
jgi:hypothetical protein